MFPLVRVLKSSFSALILVIVAFLVFIAHPGFAQPAPAPYVLQDFLGRHWHNEAVRFPLSQADAVHAKAGHALLGPDGKPVAYQLVEGEKGSAIEFLADLEPYEKRAYKFSDKPGAAGTDIKISEADGTIVLGNDLVAIAIRKQLAAGQGPVARIRLKSGAWVGDSSLKTAPTEYAATILTSGPVFAEVQCRFVFPDGGRWQINFRINAHEPVVLVDEVEALRGSQFSLSLGANFKPNKLFFKQGKATPSGRPGYNFLMGRNRVWDIDKPGQLFILEPFLAWGAAGTEARGNCFSVYNDAGTDLVSIGAREASAWVKPQTPIVSSGAVEASYDGNDVRLDFPHLPTEGIRKWMISALDKEASLEVMKTPEQAHAASLPYQYLIKHGHFPLDVVKNYVLNWEAGKEVYPHILVTKDQVARFRANLNAQEKAKYEEQVQSRSPNSFVALPEPIVAYFVTGNEALGKYLVQTTKDDLQTVIDSFLQQPFQSYGAAPHDQPIVGQTPLFFDAALSTGLVSAQERQKMLAQLAFIGYTINRPDYWSVERGYSGTPNMTTVVNNYRVVVASAIPSHPQAAEWAKHGLAELKEELDAYSDDNGGYLESPGYTIYALDQVLSSFVMAYNAGLNNYLYESPKIQKIGRWLAKISTPPDSRAGGKRHLPPIGHTHINAVSGEFGLLAALFKEKDPAFAAEMAWMYREQGSYSYPGIGGGDAGFPGYRQIITNQTLPEKTPRYESELFPNVGVLLRNQFPSDRETQLHLLAGSFSGYRSHWDNDSGSVTLWGKGRIIADDFGYPYGGAGVDIKLHSLLENSQVMGAPIFNVEKFVPTPAFDYVSGKRGSWQRQIAFIKEANPLMPNFFVFRDTESSAAAGTLRLWFTAEDVKTQTDAATVKGKEDVDTDIFFVTPKGENELSTEAKTLEVPAIYKPDGNVTAGSVTQIALKVAVPGNSAAMYVIYPRLKSEQAPTFKSLAGGRAVEIQSEAGTDYVFLSDEPFEFEQGTIRFQGKSGSVRFRGQQVLLSLGEGASISARGKTLTTPGSDSGK